MLRPVLTEAGQRMRSLAGPGHHVGGQHPCARSLKSQAAPGPMLTVKDLLSGLDVRLLSGQAAIDVPVRWVHISELQDATPWLSGARSC